MNLRQVILPEQKYSFLAGAGISFDSPSNLPLANGIVYRLLDALNIDEDCRSEFKHKFDINELRFEQFIEQIIISYSDEALHVFHALSENRSPNRIHHFLANAIGAKHSVFTTNFDTLIEQAGKDISCLIQSIYDEKSVTSTNRTSYPLFKLHGTLDDENGEDCRESVIGTIRRIGKNGEAFAFAPFFKAILTETIQNCPLIILGYSGSDDFDIIPVLAQISSPRQLIWIEHSNIKNRIQILESSEWDEFPEHVRKVVNELLAFGTWTKDKITVLVGNTSAIATEIEKILIPHVPVYKPNSPYQFPEYYYDDWKYEHALEAWRDKVFVANVYRSLGEYLRAALFLQEALRDVESLSETYEQIHLHLALSEINLRIRNPEIAKYHLDQAAQLRTKMDATVPGEIPSLLNEYGAIYYTEMGDLSEAEAMLQKFKPVPTDSAYPGYLYALSQILSRKGCREQARSLAEESLQIHRRNGNLDSIVYCLSYLAEDDAENGDYRPGLNSILEAIRICSLTHNFALLAKCYESRSRLYGKLGLLGKAYNDLGSALQIYESRLKADFEMAICLARMASIMHRVEQIRSQFAAMGQCRISGHYIEGLGCYYSPSDMPKLMPTSGSVDDGYILSNGKKRTSVDEFPSGLISTLDGPSFSEDTSLLLVLDDELPGEAVSSKAYGIRAIQLAKDSRAHGLLEHVLEIVSFDSAGEESPIEQTSEDN